MNSCLYACDVLHYRLEPRKNRFLYKVFMFYLDLDELNTWSGRLWLLSRNRPNVFSFWDADHLQRGRQSTKDNILDFLASKGVLLNHPRVMLLTHLRTFGHLFNPVSFYFCFDQGDRPLCAVAEVGNTFHEMKPYLLPGTTLRDGTFVHRAAKNFYVSPFMDLDIEFDFRLGIPAETLSLHIDDYKGENKILLSSVTGRRTLLSNRQLVRYLFRFPVITVQIIALIHWQAFILLLKRVPYLRKAANPQLQQEIYNARHRY